MPLPQRERKYTYADYCTWDDGERWELIDGVPYLMSPAPGRRHQEISGALFNQLYNFLEDKPCKIYSAPFDVRLAADGEDDTVCQPDIIVVCDKSKLDDKGCKGAPDLVIEVLSPSSTRMDVVVKFEKYREAGVREYWIVSPDERSVQAFLLDGERYYVTVYTDEAPVQTLAGCVIDLKKAFSALD
ncbi:MAG: Uma2 family endonuclease [Acidobacteriota bacterium]|jgi:Uma2 family endonuclease|nr:Uma2 family endonuclease [Acidobacteriota bacterium]